jgi:hypothetical protein
MAYRGTNMTQGEIAERFNLSLGTVVEILKQDLEKHERARLKARRYSASKVGGKNPALGKTPPNFKGECDDGYGYLTKILRGKRHFVHRIVAAEMLGIRVEDLPSDLHVHHINGVTTDNSRDNLAIATSRGHRKIHKLMS